MSIGETKHVEESPNPNPYIGPRAFRSHEAHLFHGRRRESASLADLLIAERIVLLHSPSGAGKSSLIQAGLIPRLRQAGFRVLPTIRVGQQPPEPDPAIPAENRFLFSTLSSLEAIPPAEDRGPADVEEASLAGFAGRKIDAELAGMGLDRYLTLRQMVHAELARKPEEMPALRFERLLPMSWDEYQVFRAIETQERSRPEPSRFPSDELFGLTLDQYWAKRNQAEPVATASALLSSSWAHPSLEDEDDYEVGIAARPAVAALEMPPELLIFDQFEEVLTIDPEDEGPKRDFFQKIGEALRRDQGRWALFAVREDYLGPFEPFQNLIPTRLGTAFRLDLLREDAAIEAILNPVNRDGREVFRIDAATALARDLRRSRIGGECPSEDSTFKPTEFQSPALGLYIEPVQLQVVCFAFWNALKDAVGTIERITESDVRRYAQVDNALASYYADSLASVLKTPGASGPSERTLREWFEYVLIDIRGRRELVRLDAEGGPGRAAIERLRDVYLVREVPRHGEIWIELAHDRLIAPIRQSNAEWFGKRLSALQFQATLWARQGRPEKLLLRGDSLADARHWASEHPFEVTAADVEYLKACEEGLTKLTVFKHLLYHYWLWALGSGCAALALLFALSLVGWWNTIQAKRKAENEATRAKSSELAAKSLSLADNQPDLSLLLSLESYRKGREVPGWENVEAKGSMLNALEETPRLTTILPGEMDGADAVFSPDGSFLASPGDSWSIVLRPAGSLAEDRYNLEPNVPTSGCTPDILAFAPDGERLATASRESSRLRVWDLSRRRDHLCPSREVVGLPEEIFDLAFGSDCLAVLGAVGNVYRVDLRSGTVTRLPTSITWAATALALHPDGLRLAVGVQGPSGPIIEQYDMATGRKRETETIKVYSAVPQSKVSRLAFTTVVKDTLLGASLNHQSYSETKGQAADKPLQKGQSVVVLWDVETREPATYRLPGHRGEVTSLAFSRGEAAGTVVDSPSYPHAPAFLATGGADHAILVWDLRSELALYAASSQAGRSASVGRSLKMLVAGVPYSAQQGKQMADRLTGHKDQVRTLSFRDGKTLASADLLGNVFLWDVTRAMRTGTQIVPPGKVPGDRAMLNGSGTLLTSAVENSVLEKEPGTGIETISDRNTVLAQDLTGAGLAPRSIEPANPREPLSLALGSPDGRRIATAGAKGAIVLRNASGPADEVRLADDFQVLSSLSPVPLLVFSPDSRRLAARTGNETEEEIRVWDVATHALLDRLSLADWKISATALAFNRDGSVLALGDQLGNINVWEITKRVGRTSSPVLICCGFGSQVNAIVLSANGKFVVLGTESGTVWHWGREADQWTFKKLGRHNGPVFGLALSPDEKTVASGGGDAVVFLWDVPTLRSIGPPLDGPPQAVKGLAYRPDGRSLAALYRDGVVVAWDVDVCSWQARARAIANRDLTLDEWKLYLGDEPYQKTAPVNCPPASTREKTR